MPLGLGLPELLIILAILLLVFGPKRLPGLGRQLGGGLREFKDSITRRHDADDDDDEQATALPAAEAPRAEAVPPVAEPVAAPQADKAPDPAAPPRG